jgi:hypothetical protein
MGHEREYFHSIIFKRRAMMVVALLATDSLRTPMV